MFHNKKFIEKVNYVIGKRKQFHIMVDSNFVQFNIWKPPKMDCKNSFRRKSISFSNFPCFMMQHPLNLRNIDYQLKGKRRVNIFQEPPPKDLKWRSECSKYLTSHKCPDKTCEHWPNFDFITLKLKRLRAFPYYW